MRFATPIRAFVRPPGGSYASCLREHPVAIDVELARAQHRGYIAALEEAGIEVEALPELPDAPDSVFVEDTAVVLDTHALITRPGAPSRRGELATITSTLAGWRELTFMLEPATLDGGDVLRVDRSLLVGLSRRTNRAGLECLSRLAAVDGLAVVGVEVTRGLHLKSACSLAGPETLLVREGDLDLAALSALPLELVPVPEAAGANVLAFSDRVLISSAAPRTAAMLERRGLRARPVELSQIHAGDGALSCLSLRLSPPGAWGA
jgi:dimethylargininase